MRNDGKAAALKAKAMEELRAFWIVAAFLILMFGAFTVYRRLILGEFRISYFHYGASVVEALIVAKVILIGQALGLGKHFKNGPLIMTAVFQALLYGLLVAVFAVLEHWVEGLVHGKDLSTVLHELMGLGKDEILARMLVMMIALIPFFAFWEANEALGEDRLFILMLRGHAGRSVR